MFKAGPDPENPQRVLVRVLRDGQPFPDLLGRPYAKAFPAGAKPARVEAFCRRFATDEGFRAATLVRDAFACC